MARPSRYPKGWLPVAVALMAAIAGLVLATRNGSTNSRGPLSLVLEHSRIHANSFDAVKAVNSSGDPVATSGAALLPRTSSHFGFKVGQAIEWDVPGNEVAPHSTQRIAETLWPTYPPGKYWVWTAYEVSGHGTTRYAYTKLTIAP